MCLLLVLTLLLLPVHHLFHLILISRLLIPYRFLHIRPDHDLAWASTQVDPIIIFLSLLCEPQAMSPNMAWLLGLVTRDAITNLIGSL